MCGQRWLGALGLSVLILTGTGCQTGGSKRASAPEPGLSVAPDSNSTIVEAPQAKSVTYVDRHPMFSKPREYWENSPATTRSSRPARRRSSGVPVGLYGELKQIVVGTPPATR